MRGGLVPWKRGLASQGVKQALDYAFSAGCDATVRVDGIDGAAGYAADLVERFVVEEGRIRTDLLNRDQLETWLGGGDPLTGLPRGREAVTPDSYLVLDGTINGPKSYSIAAMLDPDIAAAYAELQDRLRDRIVAMWQAELNARRGHAGKVREDLARIEVVELKHKRSRALDPHEHRHLWLNAKVQGMDGRWTTVDSRVAMKFHTVVNAEGELAMRTDPVWVAALAAKGYTLNADGEIAELAAVVRPMSRRSNQIESNRAVKLAEWYAQHPGQEPTADDLTAIDQWAWAHGRPNKPHGLDEGDWQAAVIDELTEIDPTVTAARAPADVRRVNLADLDRDLLAATAVATADKRASASGGRFSRFDLRAGALTAVAASGVVADRAVLSELVDDTVDRALDGLAVDLLAADGAVSPQHVKNLMSSATLWLKQDTSDAYARLSAAGTVVDGAVVDAAQDAVLETGVRLDERQAEAAAALAGTDRLVVVTGPAGTGKTTMLKVVTKLLADQGRQCIAIAPTKKAANVVGREIGADSSSVHALLRDHGWIWETHLDGREVWRQLTLGERWPGTTIPYTGPKNYILRPGDRVVVDEAGMLDLNAARALAIVTEQTGADLAAIGDPHQVRPVGHSGALAIAQSHADKVVELATVQRFRLRNEDGRTVRDDRYAELSLRMRDPRDETTARQVAQQIVDDGHTVHADGEHQVVQFMASTYLEHTTAGRTVSLVVSTNDEAQRINETIQRGRLERGDLSPDDGYATGQYEQPLYVGDVVQTRRNDTDSDVANRDLWTVAGVDRVGRVKLSSVARAGEIRIVDAEYVNYSVHLAYASTVHGIQGETTDVSITGPGVDAAGLYVGMTRGKWANIYVSMTEDLRGRVSELADTMRRGRIEVTIEDSRTAAREDLSRAALPLASAPPVSTPAWGSPERPYSHVDDILALAATVHAGIENERAQAELLATRVAIAEQRLADAMTAIAAHRDRGEETSQVNVAVLQERLTKLQDELSKNRAERLTAERMLEQVQLEATWRSRLAPEETAAEDASRRDRAANLSDTLPAWLATRPARSDRATGPVIRPQGRRGGRPRR